MGDIREYYTTCFEDQNGNIMGRLYVEENIYIDFGCRDIFRDGRPQRVSETAIKLLEYVMFRSPDVAVYDKLLHVYGMYDNTVNAHSSYDRQVLRNLFSGLRKSGLIDIKNKPGKGYFYKLDKKIARFNVDGSTVSDMGELFHKRFGAYPEGEKGLPLSEGEEAYVTSAVAELTDRGNSECLEFSSKFFSSGALRLMKGTKKEALDAFVALDKVYGAVSSLSGHEDAVDTSSDNLFMNLYSSVVKECKNKNCGDVLKVKGPLGSYKNRVMQYLYIALEKNNPQILPFYIDIAYYEKQAESDKNITEAELIKAFRKDIDIVSRAFDKAEGRIPLLMLDGVRDFSVGNEGLYYAIKESLKAFDSKKIICLDSDFTVNVHHQFKIHPLTSASYCMYLRIRSMNLYNREESIDFIRNCIDIFRVSVPAHISAESIYESLVRLNFISLDAYWLVYLLNSAINSIVNSKNTISDIYGDLALSVLGSVNKVESAAEVAYEFEFGKLDIGHDNPYYDIRWKLIRKHRSMLDFLIAKEYITKLSEISVDSDSEDNLKKLDFFNMVLQKRITRFIVSMLRGNDSCEHRIMVIAKKHYEDLSRLGKSELTFWMARLNNKARKDECRLLLEQFNEKDKKDYESIDLKNTTEKHDAAFLLRGSSVSLIYEHNYKAFKEYITSLVTDKVANAVNRGFHLEYYGDKAYIANETRLDYKDVVSKGENTFNVLCGDLDRKMKERAKNDYVFVLELMTLCNLIQARIEKHGSQKVFDVSPYVDKCKNYIGYLMGQNVLDELTEAYKYLRWFRNVLSDMEKDGSLDISYNPADVFNTFSKAKGRSRKGWVNRRIPQPENIVEHMYNCWLMAMLYLPEKYNEAGYCKNTILSMLLIHDMGETITGDIDREEKLTDPEAYALAESEAMDRLLFAGTYPEAVHLSTYMDCWNKLEGKQGINYRVAKDIDEIQAVYQYCVYYKNNPGLMTKEDAMKWLPNIAKLKTNLGSELAEMLILNNPQFKEIIDEIYQR
ncbi:MAG: HD domain-containing protein [Clostridia bacterium]|nr:HD domain-containing protein [Clostridia bacterium]